MSPNAKIIFIYTTQHVKLDTIVSSGRYKYECANLLLQSGINILMLSDAGRSVLVSACANPDSDPRVIRLLLDFLRDACSSEKEFVRFLNRGCNPITLKWKTINFVSKCIVRTSVLKSSGVISSIALSSGSTALHFAVIRGDVEIVDILLKAGADSLVKNGLGLDCFALCEAFGPFPEIENSLISSVDIMDLASRIGLKRVESMFARRMGYNMKRTKFSSIQSSSSQRFTGHYRNALVDSEEEEEEEEKSSDLIDDESGDDGWDGVC